MVHYSFSMIVILHFRRFFSLYFSLKMNSDISSTNTLPGASSLPKTKLEIVFANEVRAECDKRGWKGLVILIILLLSVWYERRFRTCIMHVFKYSSRIQCGLNEAALAPVQTYFFKRDPVWSNFSPKKKKKSKSSETATQMWSWQRKVYKSFEMRLTMSTVPSPLINCCSQGTEGKLWGQALMKS